MSPIKFHAPNLNVELVPLHKFMTAMIDGFKVVRDYKKVKIDIKVTLGHSIKSDQLILHSIFQNLLDNIFNFISHPKTRIEIEGMKHGTCSYISIQNCHQRLPRHKEAALSELFRGNQSVPPGGLGIYIAKKAIEKVSGRINFRSELHSGYRFDILLPDIQMATSSGSGVPN